MGSYQRKKISKYDNNFKVKAKKAMPFASRFNLMGPRKMIVIFKRIMINFQKILN